MYKESQKLQIEYEIDSDYLKVSLTDGATSCDKYFDIPLLTTDDSINNLDMGESQVDLTMSSKKYTELISQFELFNATINFKLSEDKINLYTNSCNGNMNIELDISNIDLDEDIDEKLGLVGYAIDEDLVLQQIFSVRYMKLISKFDKLSNDIGLSFIQDRPVVVEYSIQDNSYMKFYLAPRDDLE
jgi:Proliferating cell nuclear antigen, C-terminal domain.